MTSNSTTDDMFGIKLIYPDHLSPECPYFSHSLGDDLPALMNFNRSSEGRALAKRIPVGHRCLVYVTEFQLFIWAIEFTGTIEEGEAARVRHGIRPGAHGVFSIYRPIRFIARAEPFEKKGGRRHVVCEKSGVPFTPTQGDSHVFLSRQEYDRMYRAVTWTDELKGT